MSRDMLHAALDDIYELQEDGARVIWVTMQVGDGEWVNCALGDYATVYGAIGAAAKVASQSGTTVRFRAGHYDPREQEESSA